MKAHCLFEQSGTFKKEFQKLGIEAIDYDIQNEFGETDKVCDLYAEIKGGYNGEPSIFDDMTPDDVIMSFFPCTRFEAQILLFFRGDAYQDKNKTLEEKLEQNLKLHRELSENYELITKLSLIVLKRGLRMVFENPYSEQHYLWRYWCMKPQIIDTDRRDRGDYYKKPTMFYFIGFEPKNHIIFEPLEYVEWMTVNKPKSIDGKCRETMRSMIHPQYANRFIREHIL